MLHRSRKKTEALAMEHKKNARLNRVEEKWEYRFVLCFVHDPFLRKRICYFLHHAPPSLGKRIYDTYPTLSPASPFFKMNPFYEPTGNPTTVSWSIPLLTVGFPFIPWDLCTSSIEKRIYAIPHRRLVRLPRKSTRSTIASCFTYPGSHYIV